MVVYSKGLEGKIHIVQTKDVAIFAAAERNRLINTAVLDGTTKQVGVRVYVVNSETQVRKTTSGATCATTSSGVLSNTTMNTII